MFFVKLFTAISDFMAQSFWFAVAGAFIWGMLSLLLSPCSLSSIPLMIGFISAQQDKTTGRAFRLALVFSFGILLSISLLGIVTAALGRLMGDIGRIGDLFVAILFILIGLYLMDILPVRWPVSPATVRQKGLAAAFMLGFLFGVALGPCMFAFIAPVLGLVFTLVRTNVPRAALLLGAYATGYCGLIVAAGTLTGRVQTWLNWTQKNKSILWIKRICGLLVALAGVYYLLS
ncbi:cytochrome C biogenesis protein [candidate division KSB1 bacterium]|nr:cytochrome C biogenesis protein [candidate division KSB1 bacterium]